MATNKRKDAAALFELIDRSTLKVPKNAGALKIPSWWHDKTNPASNSEAKPTPPAPPTPRPVAPRAPVTPPPPPAPEPKTQAKLFEPPPSDVEPAATPSIRPPSARIPAPITAPVKVPTPAPTPQPEEAAEFKPTEAISEQDLPPDVPDVAVATSPRPTRVFAPQTHAQDRKPWSPPRPGSFARLPTWVLGTGIGIIVLVVCLIVYIGKLSRTSSQTTAGTRGAATNNAATHVSGGILPPPPTTGRGAQTAQVNNPGTGGNQVVQTEQVRPGVVYPGMTFQYEPTKFYVQACSTPSSFTATTDAGWLTEQGIDVAIEPFISQGKTWYALIATRAFSSQTEAEPFRRQIVQIGNAHVPNAWNTAMTKHVIRTASSAPATRGRMP